MELKTALETIYLDVVKKTSTAARNGDDDREDSGGGLLDRLREFYPQQMRDIEQRHETR